MELRIGETIKRLRREKDISQDKLADYLNISSQAISKWETGLTYPDITLIPSLARFFGVSTDEILGMNEDADRQRVDSILEKYRLLNKKGLMDENLAMLTDALREFPNNYQLISAYCSILFYMYSGRGIETNLDEIVNKCELILQDCTEDSLRHRAIQLLVYCYKGKGWIDKAMTMIERMPEYINKEKLIVSILEGDKKISAVQNLIHISFFDLQFEIGELSTIYTGTGEIEKAYKLMTIRDALYYLIAGDAYSALESEMSRFYYEYARLLMQVGDIQGALNHLGKAAELAVIADSTDIQSTPIDNILFDRIDRSKWTGGKNYNETESELLAAKMGHKVFDEIRDTQRFQDIVHHLTNHERQGTAGTASIVLRKITAPSLKP